MGSLRKFKEGKIYYSTINDYEGTSTSSPKTATGRTIPQIRLYRCIEVDDVAVLENIEDESDVVKLEGDRHGKYPRLTNRRYERMQNKLKEARTNVERYSDLFDRIDDFDLEDQL